MDHITPRLEQALIEGAFSAQNFPEFPLDLLQQINFTIKGQVSVADRLKKLSHMLTGKEQSLDIETLSQTLTPFVNGIKYYQKYIDNTAYALQMAERLGGIGTWIYYEDQSEPYISPTLLALYQRPKEVFKDFKDFIVNVVHPGDRQLLVETVKKARTDFKPFSICHRSILPNGNLIYLESQTEIITDGNKILRIQGSTMDITNHVLRQGEMVKLTDQLKEKQELLSNAQKIGKIGSWHWNLENEQILWSDTLYDIFNVEKGTSINLEIFTSKVHEADLPKLNEAIDACLKYGTPYTVAHRVLNQKDGIKWVEGRGVRVMKGDQVVALEGTALDITQQMEQRIKLKEFAAKLEDKVKHRTEELESFTYSISHDLRGPLRSIGGFTQIFKDEYQDLIDEEGMRLLNIISKNTNKMSALIDDLLTFSKLGKTDTAFQAVSLKTCIQTAWKNILQDVPEAQNVAFSIPAEIPEIIGNKPMLIQVFTNLFSNAVKYSRNNEAASVEITIEDSKPEEICLNISDNGVGFDPLLSDKLFKVFERLHTDNEFEGEGVGLALVKRIIDRHHGKIWATSSIGNGASFYIVLPLKPLRSYEN